ncbi:MAG: PfkB domain protein [Verrucomicrobia bacterium]|nr:PfkB domain protein [Verrucomicrobiota bacterium]
MDRVKTIDRWPSQDALASIVRESVGNGGSPYNVLVDLARLGADFPLAGVGLVGDDEDGRAIVSNCRAHGIDPTQLRITAKAPTSYTDVMTAADTGRRTFFHRRGANSHLGEDHFDFTRTTARIFHLGYLLLLDQLDRIVDGRPAACKVLERARSAGLLASIDCVSEDGERFQKTVAPVLPYVDILFANDFETEKLTGISLRVDDRIGATQVALAGRNLLRRGVQSWAIVHFPEAVYACSITGEEVWQPSVRVARDDIAGAAGAGDALAAAVLMGIHQGWAMADCLRLGVAAAAMSLYHPSCSEGVKSAGECLALARRLGYQPVPA